MGRRGSLLSGARGDDGVCLLRRATKPGSGRNRGSGSVDRWRGAPPGGELPDRTERHLLLAGWRSGPGLGPPPAADWRSVIASDSADASPPRLPALQLGLGWFPEMRGGLNRYYFDLLRFLPLAGVDP